MRTENTIITRSLVLFSALALTTGISEAVKPPPNEPAEIRWKESSGQLVIQYNGSDILEAAVTVEDKDRKKIEAGVKMEAKETTENKVELAKFKAELLGRRSIGND